MKSLSSIMVLIVCLLVGACGMLSPMPSADQINNATNNPNSNATVVTYTGTGGQATITNINTDRGALGTNGGSASVKPNGEILIIVNPKPAPVAVMVAPKP